MDARHSLNLRLYGYKHLQKPIRADTSMAWHPCLSLSRSLLLSLSLVRCSLLLSLFLSQLLFTLLLTHSVTHSLSHSLTLSLNCHTLKIRHIPQATGHRPQAATHEGLPPADRGQNERVPQRNPHTHQTTSLRSTCSPQHMLAAARSPHAALSAAALAARNCAWNPLPLPTVLSVHS